jgi:competence protein ComEC
VTVLDVGQGDSILLDPDPGDPLLVDAGPPEGGVSARLRELGIERLAALAVTHDQADHSGGVAELLSEVPVDALLHSQRSFPVLGTARALDVPARQVSAGDRVASGRLRVEVLWPPRERVVQEAEDPNQLALVLLARWRHFEILLTGDAEAELAPVDPDPVDVLKVAHHGSADPGLERLLDRSAPRLALISVGAGNRYGHPSPETLATLAEHGVATMRTDLDGELAVDVRRRGWEAVSAR